MAIKDAYENAYRWHRTWKNGIITDSYYRHIESLFLKNHLIAYWDCAMQSLRNRNQED